MKSEHYEMDMNLWFKRSTRTAWHVVRSVVKYLVVTVSLAIFYYVIFALVVNTDSEKKLKRENRLYASAYSEMLERERLLSDAIEGLELKDSRIYDEVFHAKAPKMDPIVSGDYLSAADTIPDKDMVDYALNKIEKSAATASTVEANFRKILALNATEGMIMPPMTLPLENISYAQVGASVGLKVNPFYKVETAHNGLDLVAPQGDPVLAAADGVVTDVTRSRKGQGNVIEITHDGGFVTRYAHVNDLLVSKGQKVTRGRRIASVGISGNSFAPHLHYEILKDGRVLDPVDYMFASVSPDEYASMKYMASRTGQSLD